MNISQTSHWDGSDYLVEYHDADSFDHLLNQPCRQVLGLCFYNGLLIIGQGARTPHWGLIGGTIEPGETFRQTLDREIKEESNMKVLEATPVGYQIVTKTGGQSIYQLRYWARVEPYGDFISDPDGGIAAIKLINPTDYQQYFDWGRIGDRLITRATAQNQNYKS